MTLNLHGVVDRALERSDAADPHLIARDVLMRIKPEERDQALLIALAAYVEARINERQGDAMPTPTVASADSLRTHDAR